MSSTILDRIDAAIAAERDELDRLMQARRALLGHAAPEDHPALATKRPITRRAKTRRNGTSRAKPNGTQAKVLATLAQANGPLTAGQIAQHARLGRASVSTTLSKLARAGTIDKAARGYTTKAAA